MNQKLFPLLLLLFLLCPFISKADENIKVHVNDTFSLVSAQSGLVLDISGGRTADGSPLMVYKFHGQTNQQFRIYPAGDEDHYFIESQKSKKFLDIGKDGLVVINAKSGSDSQKWKFFSADDELYTIISKVNGKVMDVRPAANSSGRITLSDKSSASPPLWKIRILKTNEDPVKKKLNDELFAAVRTCDIGKVKELLDKGADPNAKDKDKLTPIYWAVYDNAERCLELVKLLVKYGASVKDLYLSSKINLLHRCARIELAEYLLGLGLDVNARTANGDTKLILEAGGICEIKFIQMLLKKGADVNIRNKNGRSALYQALRSSGSKQSQDVAILMIERGAEATAIDDYNNSVLMFVSNIPTYNFLIKRFPELINKPNSRGQTPIMSCAFYEQPWAASWLFKLKANLDARDSKGRTAVMYASIRSKIIMLKLLIKQQANINSVDENGNSALHHALIEYGNEKTIRILLDGGIDVNLENKRGTTALDLARQRSDIDVVGLLEARGARAGKAEEVNTRFNDYGGRTEDVSYADASNGDGVSRIITEYGLTGVDVLAWSEHKELIRKRTTYYTEGSIKTKGLTMKIELYGPSALPNIGSDKSSYGTFQERREYYSIAFAENGYDLRTLHKDGFADGIVDTIHYTKREATKNGYLRKSVFGKTKTWPVDKVSPKFEEKYGERTWQTNRLGGITIDENFTKASFFYDSGGKKRVVRIFDGKGILRQGEVEYNRDKKRWTPTGIGLIRVIDRYYETGSIEREEIEYEPDRSDHVIKVVKDYKNGFVYRLTQEIDPAYLKSRNTGRQNPDPYPQKKIMTYEIDKSGRKVNVKTDEHLGGILLRSMKGEYYEEGPLRDKGKPILAAPAVLRFYAQHTPVVTSLEPESLTAYLTKFTNNELEKLTLLFYWENLNIKYNHPCADHTGSCSMSAGAARYMVHELFGVCQDYSSVYDQFVSAAVSPFHVTTISTDTGPGHMWNIVWSGGEYWHVDCTWGTLFTRAHPAFKPSQLDEWYLHFHEYLWEP